MTEELLAARSAAFGVELSGEQVGRLVRFVDLLLAWNEKINLTAITERAEVLEKHLLDSLAAAPALSGAGTVLDLGAGGGLPAIPLAVALPRVRFLMVDSVAKKVGFLKAAVAALGLDNARALHARVGGHPSVEGIEPADAAVCRAFLPIEEWLALAPAYVRSGGRILAMVGAETALPESLPAEVEALGVDSYRLPVSGALRRIAVYRRR